MNESGFGSSGTRTEVEIEGEGDLGLQLEGRTGAATGSSKHNQTIAPTKL